MVEYKPLSLGDREALLKALKSNQDGKALLLDSNTGFAGVMDEKDWEATKAATAIKSVPCHY